MYYKSGYLVARFVCITLTAKERQVCHVFLYILLETLERSRFSVSHGQVLEVFTVISWSLILLLWRSVRV